MGYIWCERFSFVIAVKGNFIIGRVECTYYVQSSLTVIKYNCIYDHHYLFSKGCNLVQDYILDSNVIIYCSSHAVTYCFFWSNCFKRDAEREPISAPFIRSFLYNTKRPSVKQSMKRKWVQNWQSANWPPHQSRIDALNTTTPNLADLLMDPLSIKHRCLEYCYTKLGRSADGPPHQLRIDALNTATPNWADLPTDPLSIQHRCLEYC